jgi:ferric-chelate reductase
MLERFVSGINSAGQAGEAAGVVEVAPEAAAPPSSSSSSASSSASASKDVPVLNAEGGVAMCVAGPESLCREAANAVALVGTREGLKMGGIGVHCEVHGLQTCCMRVDWCRMYISLCCV